MAVWPEKVKVKVKVKVQRRRKAAMRTSQNARARSCRKEKLSKHDGGKEAQLEADEGERYK